MRTGKIIDRSLPQLLHDLHQRRLTGKLIVQRDADENVIYLRDGEPVQVSAMPGDPSLGELMVELGLLTAANHRFSLATSPPVNQRYGFVLLRYGLVKPEVLAAALVEQVRRRLLPLFQLLDANYLILEQEHPEGFILDQPLRTSPESLIYQGLRTLEAGRLELLLQPVLRHVVILPEGDPEALLPFGFGDDELEVLDLLRIGSWPLRQVIDAFRSVTCLAVIGALYATERLMPMVQLVQAAPDAADAPPGDAAPAEGAPHEARATPVREARATPVRDARLMHIDIEHLAAYAAREDPFVLLGVDATAPTAAVERALEVALRTYDPKEVAAAGLLEVVEHAQVICDSCREAARVLCDPTARLQYLRERRAGQGTTALADRESSLARARARRYFSRGRLHLHRKAYAAAALEFDLAARALPERGEFVGLRAWSRYRAGHLEAAPALRQLQEAIERAPRAATLWYFAGVILRQAGAVDKAIAAQQRALRLQPDMAEASAELAGLGAQGATGTGAPSLSAQSGPGIPASTTTLPQASAVSGPRTPPSQSTQSLLDFLRQPFGWGLLGKLRPSARSQPAPASGETLGKQGPPSSSDPSEK